MCPSMPRTTWYRRFPSEMDRTPRSEIFKRACYPSSTAITIQDFPLMFFSIDKPAHRIADKIAEYYPSACSVVVSKFHLHGASMIHIVSCSTCIIHVPG